MNFGVRVPGLSCGIICVILRLAVLMQYPSVTDTRHRHIQRLTQHCADGLDYLQRILVYPHQLSTTPVIVSVLDYSLTKHRGRSTVAKSDKLHKLSLVDTGDKTETGNSTHAAMGIRPCSTLQP